jgi:hypothetical protein
MLGAMAQAPLPSQKAASFATPSLHEAAAHAVSVPRNTHRSGIIPPQTP